MLQVVGDAVTAQDNRGNGVGCDGEGSVELEASDMTSNKQVAGTANAEQAAGFFLLRALSLLSLSGGCVTGVVHVQVGLCVGAQGRGAARGSRLDRNGLHGASMTGGALRLEDCDLRLTQIAKTKPSPLTLSCKCEQRSAYRSESIGSHPRQVARKGHCCARVAAVPRAVPLN